MRKIKIELPNRDGDKNYLESCGKNKFKLVLEHPEYPVRVGETKDGDAIRFIDPSGGNPICVGEEINDNCIVESIEFVEGKGIIFNTKKI